jgi:hypothetical protein
MPTGVLEQASWVLISRPRAAAIDRLRQPVAYLSEQDLDIVLFGLQQLIGIDPL